jgi:hypothetical protein
VLIATQVWSFIGIGRSDALCGDTICENCGVFISGTSTMNSRALSNSSGTFPSFSVPVCVICLLTALENYHNVFSYCLGRWIKRSIRKTKLLYRATTLQSPKQFATHCCNAGLRRQRVVCSSSSRVEFKFVCWWVLYYCWSHNRPKAFGHFYRLQIFQQQRIDSYNQWFDTPFS